METRQITADIPNAYYDTFVKIFDGMGIKYRERNTKPRQAARKEPEPDSKETHNSPKTITQHSK